MKMLMQLSNNSITDQAFYHFVCDEHVKLQQQLKEILDTAPSQQQQQQTPLGNL